MLSRGAGAALLALGGWLLGAKISGRTTEEKRTAEALESTLQLLQSRILGYGDPLPLLLGELEREEQILGRHYEALGVEEDFSRRWAHFASSLRLSEEGREIIRELGHSLSAGAEPERALRLCEERLTRCRVELERRQRENGRLYPALCCCIGALLALLLL